MLALTAGTFTEDFQYGFPDDEIIPITPPEFDFSGTALTSQGTLVCPPSVFTMFYGQRNSDAALPFGGAPASNPYYLRYPVLSWSQQAGLFLTVTTTAPAVLSFDRAFSGYVNDRFIVTVNNAERLDITGSAGYSWTRNTISLPKGVCTIAFILKTSAAATTVLRGGTAQSTVTPLPLLRYLRLTNLSVTNVTVLPQARFTRAQLVGNSSATTQATVSVVAALTMTGNSTMVVEKTIDRLTLTAESQFSANNAFVGKFGAATLPATSSFDCAFTMGAHHFSDTGGFGISAHASLAVASTIPVTVSTLVRPLIKRSQTMTVPTIVGGRPITPLALSETPVNCNVATIQSLNRINPYSPANTLPVAATHRWLSLDADRDAATYELLEWHATDYGGPVWTTPGAYRPFVDFYPIKSLGQVAKVRYPSVQFDGAHLDHVSTALPASSLNPTGAMTWVFIGSFIRYRGVYADNSPILDFASDATPDYAPVNEHVAERTNFMPWTDPDRASSLYLGLTAYSDKDHASSTVAYRTSDADASFGRTTSLVIGDGTPVVLIYRLNGASSSVSVTPLTAGYGGSSGSTTVGFARGPLDTTRRTFSLGKTRVIPPFSGTFLTGSMTLLEVSYYNRAISDTELTSLQNFYSALYAPVAGGSTEPDYTTGTMDVTSEQVLFYAADPETPLALLTGSGTVQLAVYPSTAAGRTEMARFAAAGVPVIQVSNRDYASMLLQLEGE